MILKFERTLIDGARSSIGLRSSCPAKVRVVDRGDHRLHVETHHHPLPAVSGVESIAVRRQDQIVGPGHRHRARRRNQRRRCTQRVADDADVASGRMEGIVVRVVRRIALI
jgi:hypothetical protein